MKGSTRAKKARMSGWGNSGKFLIEGENDPKTVKQLEDEREAEELRLKQVSPTEPVGDPSRPVEDPA